MARGVGSISLLIDSPLRDLALALRTLGPDVRAQINSATKTAAQPIWFDEIKFHALTRLKQRALVNTARVGVTSRNVLLRSGRKYPGKSGDGVTFAAEFGGGEGKQITTRSRKGNVYTRRQGATFGPVYRRGSVVYPAAAASIPRFASLWLQTTRRTIHETIEKAT